MTVFLECLAYTLGAIASLCLALNQQERAQTNALLAILIILILVHKERSPSR